MEVSAVAAFAMAVVTYRLGISSVLAIPAAGDPATVAEGVIFPGIMNFVVWMAIVKEAQLAVAVIFGSVGVEDAHNSPRRRA
ncbi:hypothetical protein chiPu_0026029 [Chiloscyllium punctatum]|uniref:Uncharacterized protein n=1 Tax=Chiloscyllium punctatum TaxID=137246 RepID=A0A401TIC4_CHIPU|nr:hypothetical protein [Chiloscyllium punctatum]